MIKSYTAEEAKDTILKRKSIVDSTVSPQINKKIEEIFGESLTPQEVVKKIINDVKERNDTALIELTKKIDKK